MDETSPECGREMQNTLLLQEANRVGQAARVLDGSFGLHASTQSVPGDIDPEAIEIRPPGTISLPLVTGQALRWGADYKRDQARLFEEHLETRVMALSTTH